MLMYRLTILTSLGLVVLLMLSSPLMAQQKEVPAIVQVQGLDEVLATLQRLERNMQQLLTSHWEYRFLQRNRLDQLNDEVPAQLDRLGRQGWELVNVSVQEGFLLKRRIIR